MTKLYVSFLALVALGAAPAFAGDLPTGVVAAPASAAVTTSTVTFETDPEFAALENVDGNHLLADWFGKATLAHAVAPGFSIAGAVQDTFKTSGFNQYYFEASAAYKATLTKTFAVTVTGGLGYTAGNTGFVDGDPTGGLNPDQGNDDDSYLYYYVSGSADLKVDSHWTWNIINARYRNAFDRNWETPKVSTGVTYSIDATDSVFANVGYSWKKTDATDGLVDDKISFGAGYKYSF